MPLENDKPTVVALREIADGLVTEEMLQSSEPAAEESAEEVVTDIDILAETTHAVEEGGGQV